MYQLNLDRNNNRVYKKYWNDSKIHYIEKDIEQADIMWICPKCKKDFKNKNHYCNIKPKTIDEYIYDKKTK